MSRLVQYAAALLAYAALAGSGCSVIHEVIPEVPSTNIPRTSLTRTVGERRALRLNDIGDIVVRRGHYENSGFKYILGANYEQECLSLGLDSSAEPPVTALTRFHIFNRAKSIDQYPIADASGSIDIEGNVFPVVGRRMKLIREDITRKLGSETGVNLDNCYGDTPPTAGVIYFMDLTRGAYGRFPLAARLTTQVSVDMGLPINTPYVFVARENERHRFVLVFPVANNGLIPTIPFRHNDVAIVGARITDLQEIVDVLTLGADKIMGKLASMANSAVAIDKADRYFDTPRDQRPR